MRRRIKGTCVHRPTAGVDVTMGPVVIDLPADGAERDEKLSHFVALIRDAAEEFVFLCGGAGGMSNVEVEALAAIFAALPALARRGVRICVGDGGTDAGIMRAAGLARRSDGATFPLVGVAPAEVITTTGDTGKVSIDPNHSHVVAVRGLADDVEGSRAGVLNTDALWGTELAVMLELFSRLARDRPAVALAANGAERALDELFAHLDAGRPVVLLEGTGRATDAVVALLRGTAIQDADLGRSVRARGLSESRRRLLHVLPMSAGADALAALVDRLLEPQRRARNDPA